MRANCGMRAGCEVRAGPRLLSTARQKTVTRLGWRLPEWPHEPLKTFVAFDKNDPLSKMQAVQITRQLLPECWDDCEKLAQNEIFKNIAGQLYAAMGSILANLGEGYSRSSGRDRAKIFEYALGSVRESMEWYRSGIRVIGSETVGLRLGKLEEVRRLLLATIPRERDRLIRPKKQG